MAGLRIAVTGANGFVGRQVVLEASGRGHEVVGLVRSGASARAVASAGGRAVVAPNLHAEGLAAALDGARAVVHLASIGAERPGETYDEVNLGGMRRVVEAARAAGVPRVVYFSGLGVTRYGMSRRCTNRYFLSKLASEVELYRSGREAVVFRPSYILGPGDGLVPGLVSQMAAGEVERVGDGRYRMQPIHVRDAAAAAVAAVEREGRHPAVIDLVGPEPVSFQDLLERVGRLAREQGRAGEHRIRQVAVEDAERRAAAGGFHGLGPDSLDCLLCDEVADRGPLEALLGRFLTTLEDTLAAAVRGAGTASR
jgi:NADH dehydrogenase